MSGILPTQRIPSNSSASSKNRCLPSRRLVLRVQAQQRQPRPRRAHKTHWSDGNRNQVPPGSIGRRIGVSLGNLSREKSQALGLSAMTGALVEQLEPNGAAQKAGVRIDDVITSLNGAPIVKAIDVRTALRHWRPAAPRSSTSCARASRSKLP